LPLMRRVGGRFGTGSPPTEARARAPAQGPWPRAHGVNIEILIAAALLGAFGVAVAGGPGAPGSRHRAGGASSLALCSPRARRKPGTEPLGPAMSALLRAPVGVAAGVFGALAGGEPGLSGDGPSRLPSPRPGPLEPIIHTLA
jgi:hypothetical protein